MKSERDPITDPQPGDKVQHIDGGQMYVRYVTSRRGETIVQISRRPDTVHLREAGVLLLTLSEFIKNAVKP